MNALQQTAFSKQFILVVSPKGELKNRYCQWLEEEFEETGVVLGIENIAEAEALLATCRPECIVLDAPDISEEESRCIQRLKRLYGALPPIVSLNHSLPAHYEETPVIHLSGDGTERSLICVAIKRLLH